MPSEPWRRVVRQARLDERNPRVVEREENRFRFVGRVNALAHRQFLSLLMECHGHGFAEVILDFSECQAAFARGMLPLLAGADALRRDGIEVAIVTPANPTLTRLFSNANWAHHLAPIHHGQSPSKAGLHLPALRFSDLDRQQDVVNSALDVVMRNLRVERDVIAGLEWSLNEITDNVLTHAECSEGGLVQVNTFETARRVEVCVADAGRGFLASLRDGHADLASDEDAVLTAIKAGTTRDPENGQGNGLAGALRIATHCDGEFGILSGTAALEISPKSSILFQQSDDRHFGGAFVYVALDMDTRFRLSEALGFGRHAGARVDIIETVYETGDEKGLSLRLREEVTGFGTRIAGRQLRTKCRNLLDTAPGRPLVIDWRGIPLVSSSFADEFIGKLFVELTPLVFAARVRSIGMEPNVHGLVDKAILQRAAQTAAARFSGRGSDPSAGET